jgi:DNA (cytosine-5)-methyltransferase 1
MVDSASMGLAQTRKRVILVAVQGREDPPKWKSDAGIPATLGQVLQGIDGAPNHNPVRLLPGSRIAKIAAHICQGQKLSDVRGGASAIHSWDIPEVFGPVTRSEKKFLELIRVLRRRARRRTFGDGDPVPAKTLDATAGRGWQRIAQSLVAKGYLREFPGKAYELRRTFNGKYRRLHSGRPANSVLTKFCDPHYFLHPTEERGLSIREAARLQGFPDDFLFKGPLKSQAIQVGNAVPPPLAEFIARWVLSELL